MYHWLLAAMSESQTDPAAMLAKASKLDFFDDYFGDMMASYLRAVDQSGLKAPALLSEPARIVFPRDKPEFVVAMFEASAFPLTSWQRFSILCDPRKSLLPATSDYDACRIIGTTMARSKGSLLARMIGSYIVRRIAPGTPLEYEMIELDRRYAFVTEMQRRLTTKQLREYPFERYMADMTGKGELETATSQLAHYDLPTEPPAGWQPEDTRALMLPEERDAWDKAHPPIPRP